MSSSTSSRSSLDLLPDSAWTHDHFNIDPTATDASENTLVIRRTRSVLNEIEKQVTIYLSKHNIGITLEPHSALAYVDRLEEIKKNVGMLLDDAEGDQEMDDAKQVSGFLFAMMRLFKTDPSIVFTDVLCGRDTRLQDLNPDNKTRPCELCECRSVDMNTLVLFRSYPATLTDAQQLDKAEHESMWKAMLSRYGEKAESNGLVFIERARFCVDELNADDTRDAYALIALMDLLKVYCATISALIDGAVSEGRYQTLADELEAIQEKLVAESMRLTEIDLTEPMVACSLYVKERGWKQVETIDECVNAVVEELSLDAVKDALRALSLKYESGDTIFDDELD